MRIGAIELRWFLSLTVISLRLILQLPRANDLGSPDDHETVIPPKQLPDKKHLLILCQTWGFTSDDGGLSNIIKEAAVHLAKNKKDVRVSCLVADTSTEPQASAEEQGVQLFAPVYLRGFSSLECLPHIPECLTNTNIDAIIGFGRMVGRFAWSIKRSSNSKRVYVACSSFPDEFTMEAGLCQKASLAFAMGSPLAEKCQYHLTLYQTAVHSFIPGIVDAFEVCDQSPDDRSTFTVISFFPPVQTVVQEVNFCVPAQAVGSLSRSHSGGNYKLIAVCAPGDDPERLKDILLAQDQINRSLLTVRTCCTDHVGLCRTFVEADLMVLPFLLSTSESFGLIALQAMSAGLPILVHHTCGLASALDKLACGRFRVVSSDKPEDWETAIETVKVQDRRLRLSEARFLRQTYKEAYSWENQCGEMLDKILQLEWRPLWYVRVDIPQLGFTSQPTGRGGCGGGGAWVRTPWLLVVLSLERAVVHHQQKPSWRLSHRDKHDLKRVYTNGAPNSWS